MAGAAVSMMVSTATAQESFLHALSMNKRALSGTIVRCYLALWVVCHAMNSADMVQLHYLPITKASGNFLPSPGSPLYAQGTITAVKFCRC
jgi:hypothetical protein